LKRIKSFIKIHHILIFSTWKLMVRLQKSSV